MPDETPSNTKTIAAVIVGLALLVTNVALGGAILAKGLRGEFVSTSSTSAASAFDGVSGGSPTVTDGTCLLDVSLQAEGVFPIGIPLDWHNESNIIVKLPDSSCEVGVSPTWTVSAWNYTFVHLAADAVFTPPLPTENERHLVKIIRGTLLDVNLNGLLRSDGHWETYPVTPPNRPVSLFLDNSVDQIQAGPDGAVIVYIKVTTEALETPLTDMTASPATDVSGPFAENLRWNDFGNVYSTFEGAEFYNMAGILLQDFDGSRLCYMQFWTLREDKHADGYHDHSNLDSENVFAEIHMATYAANGVSGMQTTLVATENLRFQQNPENATLDDAHAYDKNDQTEVQIAIPMPPGHAHGPLWSVDPETGEPTLLCSGGIQYPYHRWLIQTNGKLNSPLRYSMWVAFEHLPEDVTVPLHMLTQWPNANLQSTLDPATCTDDGATA